MAIGVILGLGGIEGKAENTHLERAWRGRLWRLFRLAAFHRSAYSNSRVGHSGYFEGMQKIDAGSV